MEDSHLSELDIDQGVSVFGVFDGHGGCEVAKYMEGHFIEELKKCESYKKGDYKNALIETFIVVDRMLLSEPAKKELTIISKKHNVGGGLPMNGADIPY